MRFEWDTKKNEINKTKHGVSFEQAAYVFADANMLSLFDNMHSDEEERWITLGADELGNILVVVHTYRVKKYEKIIRMISARRATKNETKQYYKRQKEGKK